MRAKEFITERLDYSDYLPVLKRIIKNTFYSINSDEDLYDPESKVNQFFYDIQHDIDAKVLAPLLKANPITITDDEGNKIKVRHLLMSFNVRFDEPMGSLDIDGLNAHAVEQLSATYPDKDFKPSSETTAMFLRSYSALTGEAQFSYEEDTHNGLINMDVRGSSVANYVFLMEDTKIVTAGLDLLTNNIIGGIIHEVKHFIQSTSVIANFGYNADVNKYHTGDVDKLNDPENYPDYKSDLYAQGEEGYWLNADEMNSWSANAAAEINNIFGSDTESAKAYINAIAGGQEYVYNGVPVWTTLGHYYNTIFDDEVQVNTDRNNLWKKFIKDVYKDVQMYQAKQAPSKVQQHLAKNPK
jgi:hypothetical protein